MTLKDWLKELVTYKIPVFTAWLITRPVSYMMDIDYKGAMYTSMVLLAYGIITDRKLLTWITGICYLIFFIRLEYDRGEWVHWYRERYKKRAEEKQDENSPL